DILFRVQFQAAGVARRDNDVLRATLAGQSERFVDAERFAVLAWSDGDLGSWKGRLDGRLNRIELPGAVGRNDRDRGAFGRSRRRTGATVAQELLNLFGLDPMERIAPQALRDHALPRLTHAAGNVRRPRPKVFDEFFPRVTGVRIAAGEIVQDRNAQ